MSETRTLKDKQLGILTAGSPESRIDLLAGGKGQGLFRLSASGVPVPAWSVLGLDVCRCYCAAVGMESVLDSELAHLTKDSSEEELRAAASRIGKLLREEALPADVGAAVMRAYELVGGGRVAVRSSAAGEDSVRFSFAGQHMTYLNVVGVDAVIDAVRACWASAWSSSALRYRLSNSLPIHDVGMAVVLQRMVAAEKSGVLFTLNPVTGDDQEFVVSAAYGLGEAVVSGAVDSDTILLARADGAVRDETIGAKEERIDPLPGGGCETREVSPGDRRLPVLSAPDLAGIHAIGVRLERWMGGPQDIEWACAEGQLWILQSRPVTAGLKAGKEKEGELHVWDNSNIIESYGEIVAPLTYTFARHVYHGVFREHCRRLGVPNRHLARMDSWLRQLLGYFDGRVYYNLLNWYRIVRLAPFYSINRRVLEISIGADPLDQELADRQHPIVFRSRLEAFWIKTRVTIRFFWYFVTIHRLVAAFLDRFYGIYNELDAIDFNGREGHEVYALFVDMEQRLLSRWGRMNMLETSIGLTFGVLFTLTKRWLPSAPQWFLYEVVKAAPDVESVQPLRRLDAIAELVIEDPWLREAVCSKAPDALDAALRSSERPAARAVVEQIDAYLEEFGYRSANELKLEEPNMREDPSSFFILLKGVVARLQTADSTVQDDRPTADAYLAEHLRGWRRAVYELVRRRVRRCLTEREQVRFCRTRIFGLSRRMFRGVGEDLVRIGALESPAHVFYLRLEELRGCYEGTIAHRELQPLVALRREQERDNRERNLPPRFVTRGGVYWDALDRARAETSTGEVDADGVLRGTPCSPGFARGEARVVERPEDVGGGILVAYRTDPGWANVLRSASALLIERGSPLTHVAIVARELKIPTVVQIPGLTQHVRSGMELAVDGNSGTVELCGDGE